MQSNLVLLAAGRGTRYGGLKQLEGFGPHGELIMDYTIADAVEVGFTRVVLVIRREHLELFQEKMTKHVLRHRFELHFAFQEEPLGTADAARSAATVVNGPMVIANSDDYYGGIQVYATAYHFLQSLSVSTSPTRYAMLGYRLQDTLPETGAVARGLCQVDAGQKLIHLQEWYEIHREADGAIYGHDGGGSMTWLEPTTVCSMAFWLLPPEFMPRVEQDFVNYLAKPRVPGRAGEFLLTSVIEEHRATGLAQVEVLPVVEARWCGVTSPEDKIKVEARLAEYHQQGLYSKLR
ncbi:MAG: NTP transferase domain-containing protein [Symbiobacteriaceae bacterium]|nr:NTP transferase domain-containing protein [Symbiobacteriaceae bacterium]